MAFATAAVAFAGGWTGALAMLLVGLGLSVRLGIGRRLLPYLVASLPLLASILLVDAFFYPGAGGAIIRVGPLAATAAGTAAGSQAALRVLAFVVSVAVFTLSTPTDDLLADLERRGLGRRAAYVIGAAITTVPAMLERGRRITDAQRARGLDTEGSVWHRFQGLLPLAGPLITGSIAEVEERSLALEARGFSAPGPRTVLRSFADSTAQRSARWAIAIATVALVAATVSGGFRLP